MSGKVILHRCSACGHFDNVTSEVESQEATSTPPNPPLTLLELCELEEDEVVWIVFENGRSLAMGASPALEWEDDKSVLFFAYKPTPADIVAARAAQKGASNV